MKANSGQCHLLPTTNSLTSLNTNGFQITNSNEEKLLGIKFDSELSLLKTKKASQQLHAVTKIVNYMKLSKRKALTFIISQFNYCPLI